MKLNLGSGGKPLDNYINVDKNPRAPEVDLLCDLDDYPWPFQTESVEEVVMYQCLEHLLDPNKALGEIHRVLRKGKIAKISVPHFTWQLAYTDPTHRHFFAYNTFFYYTRDNGYFDFKYQSCKARLTFGKRLSIWNFVLEPLFNKVPNVYEQSPLRIFPCLTLDVELIK